MKSVPVAQQDCAGGPERCWCRSCTCANSKPTNIPSLLLVLQAHMQWTSTLVPTSKFDCLQYANTERGGLGELVTCSDVW